MAGLASDTAGRTEEVGSSSRQISTMVDAIHRELTVQSREEAKIQGEIELLQGKVDNETRQVAERLASFASDDVKISGFTTHTLGFKLAVYGRALGLPERMAEWRGEVIFEYVDQNNRFGNAGIAHAALSVPFEY